MVSDLEDRVLVWQRSLRPLDPGVQEGKRKPSWNVSRKWNSPSMQTNREGGSLWTSRKLPPRPPKPETPPPPKEPTPPPTPPPEPEPVPQQIPWRDRYQFEPLGATLGRTNIIESAIRQIHDEKITAIGHYPRDGFVNDHFTESRCSSRLSDKTSKTFNSVNNHADLEDLRYRASRSRSKSPGVFSNSTVSSRQRQRQSVDYTFGQYQFSNDLPPPPEPTTRPEPEWDRRPSQAFSDDSKMSSFKSNFSSSSSRSSYEKKKPAFKRSDTILNGPMPIWLDNEAARGC